MRLCLKIDNLETGFLKIILWAIYLRCLEGLTFLLLNSEKNLTCIFYQSCSVNHVFYTSCKFLSNEIFILVSRIQLLSNAKTHCM